MRPSPPPRRRTLVVAVVVTALVALGVGASVALLGHDGRVGAMPGPRPATSAPSATPSTGTPAPDRDRQQLDALTGLLGVRSRAVLAGDRDAWLSTVDPRSSAFRSVQAAVFEHLDEVPFSLWTYQFVGRAPPLSAARLAELDGEAWVARVLAGYRIRNYDTATSYTEQYLTVVRRDDRWYLAADTDGGSAPQPWDLGRVQVVRGARVVVLGTAPVATLRGYAVAGDAAIRRVSEVWGSNWSRRAVLVAPRTQSEFGRLLLREAAGLSQIAAVTTGDLAGALGGAADADTAPPGRAGNDRVVINPGAFARLGATGRRVVLTHEMVHVAVRSSTTASVPIWLSEGFADYVGYRGTGVSRRAAAGDLLVLVRAGRGPTQLPTAADFDPTRTTIAPSYSAAYLASALIADEYGVDALVALYRRAATAPADAAGADPDAQLAAAFPQVLDTTTEAFTKDWRAHLARLARS